MPLSLADVKEVVRGEYVLALLGRLHSVYPARAVPTALEGAQQFDGSNTAGMQTAGQTNSVNNWVLSDLGVQVKFADAEPLLKLAYQLFDEYGWPDAAGQVREEVGGSSAESGADAAGGPLTEAGFGGATTETAASQSVPGGWDASILQPAIAAARWAHVLSMCCN
jgi:hypothetical protein